MREIKFRAWVNEKDNEYSRMVHSEQAIVTILGHKYGGKGVAKPAGFSDIDNQPKPERYVLMQYTGLKDKNGKEIYEGDIVKITNPFAEDIISKVVWGGTEYPAFDLPKYDGDTMNAFSAIRFNGDDEMEVIGNIFEHKELLEVKK